jgi:hypothetical protein
MLVLQGSGCIKAIASIANNAVHSEVTAQKGDVYFVPAKTPLEVSAAAENVHLWIAAVNSRVFSDTFKITKPTESPAVVA